MKILFVPYRFGTDLIGGAELYHLQIVRNLIRAGHDVDVLTTTAGNFEPKTRFGLLWQEAHPAGDATEDIGGGLGCRVIRCAIKNPALPTLWFACYRLQKQFEQEQRQFDPTILPPVQRPQCFSGWQFPEVHGAGVWRWSSGRASLILPPGARHVIITGQAPWRRHLTITNAAGNALFRGPVSGAFELQIDIPDSDNNAVLWLDMPVRWGPAKDVRTLGIFVNRITAETPNGICDATLWEDFHHSVSRHCMAARPANAASDGWVEQLCQIARNRDPKFNALFDLARGPQSPALEKWLAANGTDYDVIIAANFPFATPSAVMRHAATLKRPVALLPLMHLDDEFYYWAHYLDHIARANAVLTISRYAEQLFREWGANSHFIGVGIEPSMLEPAPEADIRAFRARAGLADAEPYILTVSRKSPTKNYPMIINAMRQLQSTTPARLIFIGKDEDNVPINDPFVIRMEGLTNEDLHAPYAGATAFVLMSDTESFGMVFLEAWAQATPVIGSAGCRPVAALIDDGADGFLVRDEETLAACLAELLAQPDTARHMGRRGRDKVLHDYTQAAMTARLTAALDHLTHTPTR